MMSQLHEVGPEGAYYTLDTSAVKRCLEIYVGRKWLREERTIVSSSGEISARFFIYIHKLRSVGCKMRNSILTTFGQVIRTTGMEN